MSTLALRGENANRTAAYPSPENDTNMAFTLIQAIYSSGISQYLVGALLLAVLALTIGLPPKGGKDTRSRTVEWYSHVAMLFSTIAFVAALEFSPYLHDHHFFTITYTYLAFILTVITLGVNSMLTLDKRKTIEEKWRNKLDLFANSLQLWLLLTFVFGISYAWYHAQLTIPTVAIGSCIYLVAAGTVFAVFCAINLCADSLATLKYDIVLCDEKIHEEHEVNTGRAQEVTDIPQEEKDSYTDRLQAYLEAARRRDSDPPIMAPEETPADRFQEQPVSRILSTAAGVLASDDAFRDRSKTRIFSQKNKLGVAPRIAEPTKAEPTPEKLKEMEENARYEALIMEIMTQTANEKREKELQEQKSDREALPAFKKLLGEMETKALKVGPAAAEQEYHPEIRKMVLFAVERRLNQHPEISARLAGYVNARFPDYAREHGVANAEAMYLRAHEMLHTESVSMLKLLRDREAEKNKHAMRVKGQFGLVSKKLFERSEPQLVEEIAVYVTEKGEEKAREKYQAEIDRCVGFDNAKQCWRNVATRNAEKRAAKEAAEKAKKQARIDEVREYGRKYGFDATKEKFIDTPGALGIDPEPFWKKLDEDLFEELVQLLQTNNGSKKAFLKEIQLDMFKEAVLRRLDGEWGFGHQEHMDQVLKHSRAFLTTRYGKILEHIGEKAQARFALLCKQMLRSHYQDWQHLLNVRVRVTGSSAMYDIEGLDRHLWHARQQEDQAPMACKRVGLSELEFWGIVREQCEEIQRGLGPRLQI